MNETRTALVQRMNEADNAKRACLAQAARATGKVKAALIAKAVDHEAEAERLYALIMGE